MFDLQEWAIRHHVGQDALAELMVMLTHDEPPIENLSTRTEAGVTSRIRLKASDTGGAMWRNNSGAMHTPDGRFVRFGLGNNSAKISKHFKSSDLIGITSVVSTAPGQVFGVFTAAENKRPGWKFSGTDREKAQLNYINVVQALGGIAGFCQSVDDYDKMKEDYNASR
jgi:hypothetical protein